MYYIYMEGLTGEWNWFYKSANGNKIAKSVEGYKNKADCEAAIEIMKNSKSATVIPLP